MSITMLESGDLFPPVDHAEADGLLAVGGEISPDSLLRAYPQGIFPWYNEDQPVLWWAPMKRCVLFPNKLYVSKNLKRYVRNLRFRLKIDTAFDEVLSGCANVGASRENGTWLNPTLQETMKELHEMGYAHSIEAWQEGKLVGGLYGISTGKFFYGDSMFSSVPDAAKFCLYHLCQFMIHHEMELIDCQIPNDFLLSMGAEIMEAEEFSARIAQNMNRSSQIGKWEKLKDIG